MGLCMVFQLLEPCCGSLFFAVRLQVVYRIGKTGFRINQEFRHGEDIQAQTVADDMDQGINLAFIDTVIPGGKWRESK